MSRRAYKPRPNEGHSRSLPFLRDSFNDVDIWVKKIEIVSTGAGVNEFYILHVIEPIKGRYQMAKNLAESWRIDDIKRDLDKRGGSVGFHFKVGRAGRFVFSEPIGSGKSD